MKNIIFANEDRFTSGNYSEALTEFTTGWCETSDMLKMLNFIAPPIRVNRRFEFKRSDNAQSFYSETDDVRAIGGEFKRVRYDGDTVNEKTINKGLTIRIDKDEELGNDWGERTVHMLMDRLIRNELRRAIKALDTISKSQANVSWDDSENPDADIRAMLIASGDDSGIRPNRLLFGESAWDKRMTCLESQNSAVAFKASAIAQSDLASKFLLDGCQILSSRYQVSPSQKAKILGDTIYAFYAQDLASKDDASNLKRFFSSPESERSFRVFADETAKYTDITVEHYSSIIATSDLGVRKIAITQEGE